MKHLRKSLKYTVGALLAIFLAQKLGLSYAPSAGIITLLSIQETKKETLFTAGKRLFAFLSAILIATVTFLLLSYTLPSFAVYLLLFVFACSVVSLPESIAVCSVLVIHVWEAQRITWDVLLNEFLLILIGAGIGVLINLLLPKRLHQVIQHQNMIDDLFRNILEELSQALLKTPSPSLSGLKDLKSSLKEATLSAKKASGNALVEDISYYERYIEMRKNQYAVLERIDLNLRRLRHMTEQAEMLSLFIKSIAKSFHECNNAERFLQQSSNMHAFYREQPLPQTREEFESRAILFQILMDMEHFLMLKKTFADSLTTEEMKKFWKGKCEIPTESYDSN